MATLNPKGTIGSASKLASVAAANANIGDLTNKIALITGASSGLGRAISLAYAAAGAFVVNADLTPNPPPTPILAKTLEHTGVDLTTPTVDLLDKQFPSEDVARAAYVQCDVTSSESMAAAVAFTVQTYGRLDIMVNNAGISAENQSKFAQDMKPARTHEIEEAIFDKDMAINTKGVWLGMKHAVGQMLQQDPHASGDRGWIINLCSVMGLVALPGTGPYCASKGAVLQLTKVAALEYAEDKIHVNCINPGFVETSMLEPVKAKAGGAAADQVTAMIAGMHPWGRLALPDDISKMAVFLAGPGASFCTGQAFVVDGGYTAK